MAPPPELKKPIPKREYNFTATDPTTLVNDCLILDYLHPNDEGVVPIPLCFTEGQGKLILALGENASGKSFFRRVVQSVCKHVGMECIHLSMQGRTSRTPDMGFARLFVYGQEDDDSTGQNSSKTVLGAIRTSRGREEKHVLFWDEPDIGLSDSWAASVGIEIRNFLEQTTDQLVAAIIVTHNKELVKQLIPAKPHLLSFRDHPYTLDEWLTSPVEPKPLTLLQELSSARYHLIRKVMLKNKIAT
jgi:hypothetical protein